MNQTRDKDPFLNKLLRQSTIHEPSADFTQHIMDIIQQSENEKVVSMSFFARYSYWFLAISIAILLITTVIFFPSFIGHPQLQTLQNFFNPYIHVFNNIAIFLKSQPLIPIIVFALIGLFMTDKLLSRIFHRTVQHS